ncbi:MAG TPA: Gfo/Idh/MocA family oxidoreductase [Alloacidobacterium sp.]|jgi:predicted dehydrogenase|nr:Gfo/Idh/MocA family oxidoreductase [Alloacidobacterium sp.]
MRKFGRRHFLKAVGGVSALAAFGATVAFEGPRRRGPVRVALIGAGAQGEVLCNSLDPFVAQLAAVCDIRPSTKATAEQQQGVKWYQDWRQMLNDGSIEAVMIATPLCTHAEIAAGCLDAGKHVFCETGIAQDAAGCERLIAAAQRSGRILHIGYQHYYEPLYWAAFNNIMRQNLLGDVFAIEACCPTSHSERVPVNPDDAGFDPRPWGYASLDQLMNWRLYRRYSAGPMGEWGGRVISLINWFLGGPPTAVQATGGIYTYKDDRDVNDHVFVTLEYPYSRTTTLSLIPSNGFVQPYMQIMGKKGTLILSEGESLLFMEDQDNSTQLSTAPVGGTQSIMDASASRRAEGANHSTLAQGAVAGQAGNTAAFQNEIVAFCGSIRAGAPLRGSLSDARNVTLGCLAIDKAIERQTRVMTQLHAKMDRHALFDQDERQTAYARS